MIAVTLVLRGDMSPSSLGSVGILHAASKSYILKSNSGRSFQALPSLPILMTAVAAVTTVRLKYITCLVTSFRLCSFV